RPIYFLSNNFSSNALFSFLNFLVSKKYRRASTGATMTKMKNKNRIIHSPMLGKDNKKLLFIKVDL
ncbi:MAG: hypothetical protein WCG67_10225, partial [Ferruginibacter sp.]